VRNLQRTQTINKIRQPGLFGLKNVNNHHHDISVAEDSLEDYCLLEILGNEMECGEIEEHGLDGGTFDNDPLQMHSEDASDSNGLFHAFEGIMSSLSRQFSNSSQNSLSHVFPDELGGTREERVPSDDNTFDDDDDDPLQSLFVLDRQSSLIIATGSAAANDRDERKMQAGINSVSQWLCRSIMHSKDDSDFSDTDEWLCHNTMHSEDASDASDSDDLFNAFEGIMPSLSRQFSNSSQNSLSHVFPDEFSDELGLDEAQERSHVKKRSHVEKRSRSENVGIVHDSTIYPELSVREALSFLPTPLQMKTNWSIYQLDFASSNTRESLCTPIIIPQPSREIFMEGVPSKEKRQKIARYLEKRRRRIEKRQMEKKIPSYPARSNVASSRVRRGGRFVCSSEWGKRIRPPRNN